MGMMNNFWLISVHRLNTSFHVIRSGKRRCSCASRRPRRWGFSSDNGLHLVTWYESMRTRLGNWQERRLEKAAGRWFLVSLSYRKWCFSCSQLDKGRVVVIRSLKTDCKMSLKDHSTTSKIFPQTCHGDTRMLLVTSMVATRTLPVTQRSDRIEVRPSSGFRQVKIFPSRPMNILNSLKDLVTFADSCRS